MLETTDNDAFALIVAISLFVFFALHAWEKLSRTVPSWVLTGIGIASVVLAIASLAALF